MTALEFMCKQRDKCMYNLQKAVERNAPEVDIQALTAKVNYYREAIVAMEFVQRHDEENEDAENKDD